MKKIVILIATVFSLNIQAATEKTTRSKIEKVTVYLSGAQIQRTASTTLSPGNTVIVIDELEQGIDPKSIQASGTGNFIILDVKHKVKYPDSNPTAKTYSKNAKEIRLLEDSLLNIDYDLEAVQNKQDVLNTERNLLLNNKLIKGEAKNDTLPQLKDALLFLREKLNNINAELLKLKKESYKLNITRNRLQLNLDELRAFENLAATKQRSSTTYQLLVTVSAETATQATVNVSYLLYNAGWTPSYDLRSQSTNSTMQLTYKANVYQSTGTDWNDVKLTLSTSNPRQNTTKPVLSTYFLNYYRAVIHHQKRKTESTTSRSEMIMQEPASTMMEDVSKTTADFTVMQESVLSYEYNIKLAYTIPSDGQTHIVAVQNKDIPASFEHFAVPKLDNNAFLLARLSGWDDLNLIPGNANVFFDGSFTGETFIDPSNTNDTLELSMGRDRNIIMKRVKLKDKTKEKILAEERVQTVTYEITIRNTKGVSSMIEIEDQIPVSQNKEIKVELIDSAGATLDENTGKLSWKMSIKPKEAKRIQISYKVTSPKDKLLTVL